MKRMNRMKNAQENPRLGTSPKRGGMKYHPLAMVGYLAKKENHFQILFALH